MIERRKDRHREIDGQVGKKARKEETWEDEHEDIEPSPLIDTDAAYEDNDDYEDRGSSIGRFRLTKRIGAFYRPKMAVEASNL